MHASKDWARCALASPLDKNLGRAGRWWTHHIQRGGILSYPKDLREFLTALEARGKLHRFTEAINKDSEIIPLLRVEMRGLADQKRKALLFENVTDAKGGSYDMRVVAGVYGVSDEMVLLGMGCETVKEALEKWHRAVESPIPCRIVEQAPVHDVVITGEALKQRGLDMIPVPVEDPGFGQMIRTGLPMITRDPETGITNIGTYNGFFRDRDRIVAAIGGGRATMRVQWETARRRGEELPMAIVIGATPNVMLVGSATLPYGADELAIAGAIAGEPMELVRCKTIPLEVPAHAEIIIEGMISTDVFEPRFAFGEYPGYLNMERNNRPVMRVTAITYRKNAMFTPVTVGFAPSDTNAVWGFCNAAVVYHELHYVRKLPISDVYFPQMGGGNDFCIIQREKGSDVPGTELLKAASEAWKGAKYIVLVDWDIDPRNPELLIWALSFRVRPHVDIQMQPGRHAGLDPSSEPTGSTRGQRETAASAPSQYYRVLIDATLSGPYPPVALPRRDYMDRALEIWRSHQLPEPELQMPWYGYTLGYWNDEDQKLADLITAGDYKAVGRIARDLQAKTEDVIAIERQAQKQD
jgi:4-hydroxy-3-polyprenylbenzoate decarboxylase